MADVTPEVLEAYSRHEREIGLQRLRLGCWIAMILTPPGAIIDWFVLHPHVPWSEFLGFIGLRFACSLLVLPILWVSWSAFGARNYRTLGVMLALAPAVCMAALMHKVPEHALPYYAGLNLVLLGVGMVMQWTPGQSLAAVLLIFALYFAAVLPLGKTGTSQGKPAPATNALARVAKAPPKEGDSVVKSTVPDERMGTFLNNTWFLLLTAIIVVIGSHVSTKLRFSDFVARFNLDRSRRELELSNARLADGNQRLEEANQRLRELDQLKRDFFANISHELRTPLTLLLGPIEQLRMHPAVDGEERLRDCVATMQDNGLRLLKLINDLLDLVRLDAGQMVLFPVAVDVQSFVRGLMNSIRRFAEDRGLKVHCDLQEGLTDIEVDKDKLEKVFLNLLFNSVKFTPAGGSVRLSGRAEGEDAVFEVADTGVGIAPEHLPRLFQRFWQADTSANRKFQGAGIGLALVKELVEAHGGKVSVASQVGRGTTMTVRLPILARIPEGRAVRAVAPAAAPASAPTETRESVNGEGSEAPEFEQNAANLATREHLATLYKRAELQASITPLRGSLRPWNPGRGGNRPQVLAVDDEPDMLRFLRSQLEDDYDVIEAVDGDQATVMAAQYLPDAVVCDMMLPEKDGLQVCRDLRANHTTRGVPFLMLTARADDETKLASLAAGASDFLPKPFSTAELKLRLKNLVDAQRLQKELARQNKQLEVTLEELRDAELQLVQAEKMASLGRLSAGIIHEINNPLNFARTGLHILSRHGQNLPSETREEFEEVLRDIGEGITRVAGIVGDLRQFSHPDAGALHLVDIELTIDSALRFLAPEWKDGRADIVKEIPDGFMVPANRNKLVQVLLNLCQNSFDAMRDHPPASGRPSLHIRAWEENGRRRVAVRDNGPGIPEHHLPHIFEPFYTTKEVGKGMGLGLSICYRIIEEAGGRIMVNTQAGQFCEFILDFPSELNHNDTESLQESTAAA